MLQQTRILWMSLVMSVVLFGVISFVVPPIGHSPPPFMLVAAVVMAAGAAAVSFVLPRKQLGAALARLEVETTEAPVPSDDAAMFGGQPKTQKVIADRNKALRAALPAYQSAFIIAMALGEVSALCGFMLSHLGFSPPTFVPFLVAALVLDAIRYPSESRLVAALEAGTGARVSIEGGTG